MHLYDSARRGVKIKFNETCDDPSEVDGEVVHLSSRNIEAGRQFGSLRTDDTCQQGLVHTCNRMIISPCRGGTHGGIEYASWPDPIADKLGDASRKHAAEWVGRRPRLAETSGVNGREQRSQSPVGVVEVNVMPSARDFPGVDDLDRYTLTGVGSGQQRPGVRSLDTPAVVGDQRAIAELHLEDECCVGIGPSWSWLPERHGPPVIGDQDGNDVSANRKVWRQVVAVVPLPIRLRASRPASHFMPIHPEHISGVGRDSGRRFSGNGRKIECPPEHRSRELPIGFATSEKIRRRSRGGSRPMANPVTGPPQGGSARCCRTRLHAHSST